MEKSRNLASGTRRLTIITFVPQSISQFRRSVVSDSATPWTAAPQASLSITNSQSLLKLRSIESVMPSNHLILCYPLLLPPSTFPNIRVFSMSQFFASSGQSNGASASASSSFSIKWPKQWSFSFSILPMNIQD